MTNVDDLIAEKTPFKKKRISDLGSLANTIAIGLTKSHLNSTHQEEDVYMTCYKVCRANRADDGKNGAVYLTTMMLCTT